LQPEQRFEPRPDGQQPAARAGRLQRPDQRSGVVVVVVATAADRDDDHVGSAAAAGGRRGLRVPSGSRRRGR